MKRYKLLKDLPTFSKGDTFRLTEHGHLMSEKDGVIAYAKLTLKKFNILLDSDWFEEITESKRWRAKEGGRYWCVGNDGGVYDDYDDKTDVDDGRYELGNYFKTEEEAQRAANWLKASTVLRDDTKGFKPNWEDNEQDKWFNGAIKSKLLPIEIATNDYWELNDDSKSPMVIDGKKRYFTWDEAMAIKADGGWRLPTRAEWMSLCIEFGEKDGDIDHDALTKALGLGKNGYVVSGSLKYAGYSGYYWSSTAYSSASTAYYLYFLSGYVAPSDDIYRCYGQSVRLVRDVKE